MSKRDLRKYLGELDKHQLEEQIIELYEKFNPVKVYYDFVFNPREDKLIGEAKLKISNEYFPVKGKRAKLRRSTGQKYIKHFRLLGVDPFVIADIMLYTIEIAQRYSANKMNCPELFFKSMLTSYGQTVSYLIENGVLYEFKNRVEEIRDAAIAQDWFNKGEFDAIVERFTY